MGNTRHSRPASRILILRLSSMGDIILATTALETEAAQVCRIDWVVAKEFAELLDGHPRIGKVWQFDRSTGLTGWIELCRTLWSQQYCELWDLHSTLRTAIARVLFWYWGILGGSGGPGWRCFDKQRIRIA